MANKQKARKAAQTQVDDFTRIAGIKHGIESRLHAEDILTYAQLASLNPEKVLLKLGKVNGYSVRRIEEEDWIGQARELMPKKQLHRPRNKGILKPTLRQHYENFTLEFLLDEKNRTRRTHVMHVQSGDADTWAGWEAERVLDFIARHSGVRLLPASFAVPAPPKLNPPPRTSNLPEQASHASTETSWIAPDDLSVENTDLQPSFAMVESEPQLPAPADHPPLEPVPQQVSSLQDEALSAQKVHLLESKVSLMNTDQSLRNLPHDQAFDVHLTLGLNDAALPAASQLGYTATLSAKKLGSGDRKVLGEIKKIVAFEPTLVLTIHCAALSPGIYRLDSVVTIRLAGSDVVHQSDLMAFWESDPLQVY